MLRLELPTAADTEALGLCLARALQHFQHGAVIALRGDLGAGKTTLARALIMALGHSGPVVSPSYTLVEPYYFGEQRLLHLDLYRIGDPEELEYLGAREWNAQWDWLVVEWAENGAGFLPPVDLCIRLEYAGQARCAGVAAGTDTGKRLQQRMAHQDSQLF